MKVSHVLYVLAAVALPPLAQADAPLSPRALGALQGVVDFCSRVDPKDSKQLGQQAGLLMRGLSANTIAADKNTAEYKQAYQTLSTVLKEWPADEAVANCRSVAAVEKEDRPLRPRPQPRPKVDKPTHDRSAPPPATEKPTHERGAPRAESEELRHGPGLVQK
jgi:hypothetical protein